MRTCGLMGNWKLQNQATTYVASSNPLSSSKKGFKVS